MLEFNDVLLAIFMPQDIDQAKRCVSKGFIRLLLFGHAFLRNRKGVNNTPQHRPPSRARKIGIIITRLKIISLPAGPRRRRGGAFGSHDNNNNQPAWRDL